MRFRACAWPKTFIATVVMSLVAAGQLLAQQDSVVYHLYVNSSGNFSKTNEQRSFLLSNLARFSMERKITAWQMAGSWVYGEQNHTRINNDFSYLVESDILRKQQKIYYWVLATYDKSYSLRIDYRLQTGAGLGYTVIDSKSLLLVLSDGIIFERGNLTDPDLGPRAYDVWRNSFRVRYRWTTAGIVNLNGSAFFQPSLSDRDDVVIKSTTTLSVKLKKWLSLTMALNYNRLTLSGRENILFTYGILLENYF